MKKVEGEPLMDHLRYEKIQDLNAGAFGFVQLATDKLTNEKVAIKFLERGRNITKYVEREILNHRTLVHPHIIQFRGVFLTPKYLAIVLEYAPSGDMFHHVAAKGGLSETEARWYFQQLVVALDYCHRKNVVNRDIKLENTLLDGNKVPLLKMCDFGYSKHEQFDSMPKSQVGTPAYAAPEVIAHKEGYDGRKADIWSAGVMLFVMLFARYPFERSDDKKAGDQERCQRMLKRILKVEYEFPRSKPVSGECRDLIARVLIADPDQRSSVLEIQQHAWFRKGLPRGYLEYNDQALQVSVAAVQTEDEIRHIVALAKLGEDGGASGAGSGTDGGGGGPGASADYEADVDAMLGDDEMAEHYY